MCAELIERARAKLTTAYRVRAALQEARRRGEGDADAERELDRMLVDARLREDRFARLAQGFEERRYAHVDDLVARHEGEGWIIVQLVDDSLGCDLCECQRIRYVMRGPDAERRVIVGCANPDCGLGYETDYEPW